MAAPADRLWLLVVDTVPSVRLEGVVADEVLLRRASHGCAGRLCGCGFDTAEADVTLFRAPGRSTPLFWSSRPHGFILCIISARYVQNADSTLSMSDVIISI